MNVLARLLRRLWPPDCDECGGRRDGRLLGNYWHAESCSSQHHAAPEGSDNE